MKAVVVQEPGKATLTDIPEPSNSAGETLLQIRMIGLCGTDLNTFRGKNPLVTFPRVLGHEVAATILHPGRGLSDDLRKGSAVTLAPYTACGQCASCLRGRPNACRSNQTLGVQRDGALKTLRRTTLSQRALPGGTANGGVPRRNTRTRYQTRYRRGLRLRRRRAWCNLCGRISRCSCHRN